MYHTKKPVEEINRILKSLDLNVSFDIEEEEKYGEQRYNIFLKNNEKESRVSYRDNAEETQEKIYTIHDFLFALFFLKYTSLEN